MNKLLSVVLMLLMVTAPFAADTGSTTFQKRPTAQDLAPNAGPAFWVDAPEGTKFDLARLQQLYDATVLQTARELWPDKPVDWQAKRLRPRFVLVLGAEHNRVVMVERPSGGRLDRIELKKLDYEHEVLFAEGVAIVALRGALSDVQLRLCARRAWLNLNNFVTVDELKK